MHHRRDFLKKLTMLSTALTAPTFLVRGVKAAKASGMAQAQLGNPNRILLVLELAGGDDGLNTLIPYRNDRYYAARPTLAIRPEQGILTLDDEFAFHPALTGLKELWDEGKVAITRGVGYGFTESGPSQPACSSPS